MSENKFKTMRHMETVRNFFNSVVTELLTRGEQHDQTKLQSPEVEYFEKYTHKLRSIPYYSEEYKRYMDAMRPAIDHHQSVNSHHPEYHENGFQDMDLIELVELICDWKAATLRHEDGNIMKSIEINQERFGFSDEVAQILRNTVRKLDKMKVEHHADES